MRTSSQMKELVVLTCLSRSLKHAFSYNKNEKSKQLIASSKVHAC
jgi:hypothetical protein